MHGLAGLRPIRLARIRRIWRATSPFPSTMVDRIVPATTDADRDDSVTSRSGSTTPGRSSPSRSRQWVIEDHFRHGRPRFEEVGAQMVADVEPYETDEAAPPQRQPLDPRLSRLSRRPRDRRGRDCRPRFGPLVKALMTEEAIPTLPLPASTSLPIATTCSTASPIPALQAPNLADRHGRHAEAAAAPARHQPRPPRARPADPAPRARRRGLDALRRPASTKQGGPINVRDPLAAASGTRGRAGQDARQLAASLLWRARSLRRDDLAQNGAFAEPVTANLTLLLQWAKEAVRRTA